MLLSRCPLASTGLHHRGFLVCSDCELLCDGLVFLYWFILVLHSSPRNALTILRLLYIWPSLYQGSACSHNSSHHLGQLMKSPEFQRCTGHCRGYTSPRVTFGSYLHNHFFGYILLFDVDHSTTAIAPRPGSWVDTQKIRDHAPGLIAIRYDTTE